ncbi:MAG: energy-coupling factor transporter transmembrane component T family protein [Anaerotardibacter sp.]
MLYFGAVLVLSMAVFHPVFLAVNVLAGFAYHVYLKGFSATVKMLTWQIPLLIIVTVLNPLFVSAGSTELFRIGTQAFYLESAVYGFCMGLLLVSTLIWFSNAAGVLSSDKIMTVFGKFMPTIGLMITMVLRLVPQFVSRGKGIADATYACSAAYHNEKPSPLSVRLRQVTSLMEWSMEDSLETSDAMRAKGWGSTNKRSQYQLYSKGMLDYAIGAVFLLLVALDVAGIVLAVSSVSFYPVIAGVFPCWGVLSHVIMLALPLYVEFYASMRF